MSGQTGGFSAVFGVLGRLLFVVVATMQSVRWVASFPSLSYLLSAKEVPIGPRDPFLKWHLGPPSEGAESGADHKLAGGAVGLGGVPAYLAPIANDAGHCLGQFSDRQIGP